MSLFVKIIDYYNIIKSLIQIIKVMGQDNCIPVPISVRTVYDIYKILKESEYKNRIESYLTRLESNFEILRESHINHLRESKLFATVFYMSGQIALKTDDIKRDLLADAVSNTLTTQLSEDVVIILFNCFEKYTLSHLSLLYFLQDPKKFVSNEENSNSISKLFYRFCPTVTSELMRVLIHDLHSDGMITSESMFTTITLSGGFEKYTSSLGDKMIELFNLGKIPQLTN